MKKKLLGSTSLEVTPLCFGTWQIGGPPDHKEVDRDSAIKLIHSVLDLGVSFIDTAPLYGFGLSESILGEALQGVRNRVVISTKCGLSWTDKRRSSLRRSVSRDAIFRDCEDSLRRLETDYIDLYLIHWHDDKTPVSESVSALQDLKEQGLVKSFGVCNFSLNLLKKASQFGDISVLQSRLSRLRPEVTEEMRRFCVQKSIVVQAYSPLERGILTDCEPDRLQKKNEWAINKALENAPSDYRKSRSLWFSEAREKGLSLAQDSLLWVMALDPVCSVIVGSVNIEHIRECVEIFD